jgi:hypothetical protein
MCDEEHTLTDHRVGSPPMTGQLLSNEQNSQSLTEMSTRNIKIIMFIGSKVRLVHRADNLTAIYELIV